MQSQIKQLKYSRVSYDYVLGWYLYGTEKEGAEKVAVYCNRADK